MSRILTLAKMHGYTTGQSGGWSWISPCPSCRAVTRHTKSEDERGPVIVSDSERAKCLQCEQRFDASSFAASGRELTGVRLAPGHPVLLRYPTQKVLDEFADKWKNEVLVPLFDHEAVQRSWLVRFRSPPEKGPKSMSPRGFARRGLAMANTQARDILAGYMPSVPTGHIVVAEGETDFLAVCERTPFPCVGIFSGSWTRDWAAAMPAGADIMIATDLDKAGDKYAEEIRASLDTRLRYRTVRVRRWTPEEAFVDWGGNDLCDYFRWEDRSRG